jgi:hypothetical protein
MYNKLAELLVDIAKEVEVGDPIDWGMVEIDEDEAYRLMALHVLEMEDDKLIIAATLTKLLVENMVLNTKLLQVSNVQ